ncbi:MAG: hypothetical protein HY868_11650 [Chloroflexi bacterium]|nr:hypothetical protein [Chloroflexota bacterium]
MSKFPTALFVVLIAVVLLCFGILGFPVAAAPIETTDLLTGITFDDSISDADLVFLQANLRWLRDHLPEWYAYVKDAKPFSVSVGQTDNDGWLAAKSDCCDEQGNGTITFDDHFASFTVSNTAREQTRAARQVMLLSLLIHEVTHLRDYHAGRISSKMNAATCLATERSAYAKEFQFKRELMLARFADAGSSEPYRRAAEKQLADDAEPFNTNFWKLYCILAHPNIMDD